MAHVYRITDRAGSWPMLTDGPRSAPADGSVQVELVAETDNEAEAWRAWEELLEDLEGSRGPG